jgi:hypothetical protein
MVTMDEKGDLTLQIKVNGGGEHLLRIQKALSLCIEAVWHTS